MNTMMIRLLSSISLAVLAVMSADLSAEDAKKDDAVATNAPANAPAMTDAKDKKDAKHDAKHDAKPAAKHDAKKHTAHKAALKAPEPAAPAKLDESTIDDVQSVVDGKTTAVIVDARSVKQNDDIVKGAVVIPADADDKTIAELLKDKKAKIIIYCGSPSCPASTTLGYRLVELKYENVSHYAGGIKEWTEAGKDTDKATAEAIAKSAPKAKK